MEDKITMDEVMVTDFSQLRVVNASEDPQDMKMKILLSDTINWIYISMDSEVYHEVLRALLGLYAKGTDPEHLLVLRGTRVSKDWNEHINRFNYVNFLADSFEIKIISTDNFTTEYIPESWTHNEFTERNEDLY